MVLIGPVLTLVSFAVGAFVVVIIGDVADLSESATSGWAAVGAGLAFVAAAAFVLYQILALARTAAWLEGSRLTVRRVRARTVDLASARIVSLSAHNERHRPLQGAVSTPIRTPYLSASDDATTVHLRLRDPHGGLLPPEEMRALADAVSVARCPGAEDVASWFRAIAADPRSLFS
ncbi:hypothetical protein Vau01_048850 [Virgisporangium aurantiacum]|uniref:Uncharacterized protein n=1 Tax=Virgisporangium aurantiacum TaxID=175570 RepID=A0A8J4E0W4_9ACTN|nr:hypothetical protein Vau01_048850 [Virgisporangium aurantiacum]